MVWCLANLAINDAYSSFASFEIGGWKYFLMSKFMPNHALFYHHSSVAMAYQACTANNHASKTERERTHPSKWVSNFYIRAVITFS